MFLISILILLMGLSLLYTIIFSFLDEKDINEPILRKKLKDKKLMFSVMDILLFCSGLFILFLSIKENKARIGISEIYSILPYMGLLLISYGLALVLNSEKYLLNKKQSGYKIKAIDNRLKGQIIMRGIICTILGLLMILVVLKVL